ncbi:MAG: hypothetical protein IT381_17260 [Deltaproteobacteria bacterium]|nr:hypothetical protein [Deltaproteobacteria bacterium]
MPKRFHFLNVANGDCAVIEHATGHVTVVDVNNAKAVAPKSVAEAILDDFLEKATPGNFRQKDNPVNPIEYLRARGITDVFRFVLTHPDMDHMGGLRDFFEAYPPTNFWDTDNNEEKYLSKAATYSGDDWHFYESLRDPLRTGGPNRLVLAAGAQGKFFNVGADGASGGDGLHVLAPTPRLTAAANDSGDNNDHSYVLLYRAACGGKILLAGDSHDATWEYILANHRADVSDVDLLIAPHHGRKSGRCYDFLDVLRPRLTLFGNAPSEHLAYDAWNTRGLVFITNNQAGSVIVDLETRSMPVFVTNRAYAVALDPSSAYSDEYKGYHVGNIFVEKRVVA